MKLTFGTNLPTGVTEGTTKETVISITDDDVPSVTVEYGSATYSVEESRRRDHRPIPRRTRSWSP